MFWKRNYKIHIINFAFKMVTIITLDIARINDQHKAKYEIHSWNNKISQKSVPENFGIEIFLL